MAAAGAGTARLAAARNRRRRGRPLRARRACNAPQAVAPTTRAQGRRSHCVPRVCIGGRSGCERRRKGGHETDRPASRSSDANPCMSVSPPLRREPLCDRTRPAGRRRWLVPIVATGESPDRCAELAERASIVDRTGVCAGWSRIEHCRRHRFIAGRARNRAYGRRVCNPAVVRSVDARRGKPAASQANRRSGDPSAGQLVLVEHPPVSPAALAVRRCIVELVFELHESGKWPGITLRSALQ